jgi:hypothetical protein
MTRGTNREGNVMERTLALDQLDATTVTWKEQEAQRPDVPVATSAASH